MTHVLCIGRVGVIMTVCYSHSIYMYMSSFFTVPPLSPSLSLSLSLSLKQVMPVSLTALPVRSDWSVVVPKWKDVSKSA